jgi:hypothetical protein
MDGHVLTLDEAAWGRLVAYRFEGGAVTRIL